MKLIIICLLTLSYWTIAGAQELKLIRDSVNQFTIGVPVGWRYGVPVDKSVTFIALRQKLDEKDLPRENFNVNILHRDEKDLEKTYKQFLESVGKVEGFKILDNGDKVLNGRKYKYLVETHKNKISKEDMTNYVLFTNNDGEILILTMVTISDNFEKFRGLFDSVATSLSY